MPALLTSMSSRPNRSAIVAASASRCSGSPHHQRERWSPTGRRAVRSSRSPGRDHHLSTGPTKGFGESLRRDRTRRPVTRAIRPDRSPSRHCCIGIIPCVEMTPTPEVPNRRTIPANWGTCRASVYHHAVVRRPWFIGALLVGLFDSLLAAPVRTRRHHRPPPMHNGEVVHVSVSGFPPGKAFLSECASPADVSAEGCGAQLAAQPFVEIENGSGTESFTVADRGRSHASDPTAECFMHESMRPRRYVRSASVGR